MGAVAVRAVLRAEVAMEAAAMAAHAACRV